MDRSSKIYFIIYLFILLILTKEPTPQEVYHQSLPAVFRRKNTSVCVFPQYCDFYIPSKLSSEFTMKTDE